ncbi:MAG: hypothetical protein V4580_14430 [Bacteroidota bacterium]
MRFIYFNSVCLITITACTFDKGKDINPIVTNNSQICDTSAVISYSEDISRIINVNCISCHGSGESVKLNNHTNVQANALSTSASIYSAVSHDGTALPMPPSRSLSDCDIEKIKKWTSAGAPNN